MDDVSTQDKVDDVSTQTSATEQTIDLCDRHEVKYMQVHLTGNVNYF